jgi:hypothetical protein
MNADLIHRFGTYIGDGDMIALATTLMDKEGERLSMRQALPCLFSDYPTIPGCKATPLLDHWLNGIQVAVASQAASGTGFVLAAKSGHNWESHNHNDIGAFILFKDGAPGFIDIGAETYSRKTFGSERHSIWTMQSGFHNVPIINGFQQEAGERFRARYVSCRQSEQGMFLEMDIAGAYPPQC